MKHFLSFLTALALAFTAIGCGDHVNQNIGNTYGSTGAPVTFTCGGVLGTTFNMKVGDPAMTCTEQSNSTGTLSLQVAPPTGVIQISTPLPAGVRSFNVTPVGAGTATVTASSEDSTSPGTGSVTFNVTGSTSGVTAALLTCSQTSGTVGQTIKCTPTEDGQQLDQSVNVTCVGASCPTTAPLNQAFDVTLGPVGTDTIQVSSQDGTQKSPVLSITVTAAQDMPLINWPQPGPINNTTALSSTQLDATASFNGNPVAGSFSYSPGIGSTLPIGTDTLSVTFTPTDTTDFMTAEASVSIVVTRTIVLTLTSPTTMLNCQTNAGCETNITFTVSGGASDDFLNISTPDMAQQIAINDTTNQPITQKIRVGGTGGVTPGTIILTVSGNNTDGVTSNAVYVLSVNSQNLVAQWENPQGQIVIYVLSPGLNTIQQWLPTGAGNYEEGASMALSGVVNPTGIIVEPLSGNIIVSGSGNPGARVFIFSPSGQAIESVAFVKTPHSNHIAAVLGSQLSEASPQFLGGLGFADVSSMDADNGNVCVTIVQSSELQCLSGMTSTAQGTLVSQFIGGDLVSVAVSGNTAYTYDVTSSMVTAMSVPAMNKLGSFQLPFETNDGTNLPGNYIVKALASGSTITLAALGQTQTGSQVAIVDATNPANLTQTQLLSIGGIAWALEPDTYNDAFTLETWTPSLLSEEFARISTSGVVNFLSGTWQNAAQTFVDTPDGENLVFAWGIGIVPISNQIQVPKG